MESLTIIILTLLTEAIHVIGDILKNSLQIFANFLPSFILGFISSIILMIAILVYLIYRTISIENKSLIHSPSTSSALNQKAYGGGGGEEEVADQIELLKTSSYQCGWVLIMDKMEWPPKPKPLDEIKAFSSSLSDFTGKSLLLPSNVATFITIKEDRLIFYCSEEQNIEILPSINLRSSSISIHPEDLYIEECFHPEFPLLLQANGQNLFIYCPSSSEKEDWFLSIRHSQKTATTTTTTTTSQQHTSKRPSIETIFMERLSRYSSLLSGSGSSGDSNLDWLNVLVGRIFFQCFRSNDLTQTIHLKFQRKMTQSPELPKWLGKIEIDKIVIGMSAPFISNPRLHSMSGDGNVITSMDMSYPGGFVIALSTTIIPGNIPMSILGNNSFSGFFSGNASGVSVGIQLRIKSLVGRILIHIKEPPSDRLWYGFVGEPEMEVDIDIKISNTSIDWLSSILKGIISDLIIKSIKDMMVLPLMDDIPLPPLMVRDLIIGEPYFSSHPTKRPPSLSVETFPPKDPHPPPPPPPPPLPSNHHLNTDFDIKMDSLQSLNSNHSTIQPLTSLRKVHSSNKVSSLMTPETEIIQEDILSASSETISSSLKWKMINEARMSDLRAHKQ